LGEEVGMEQSGTMAMYASLNWSHLLGTERVVASCQSTGANPIFGTCSFTCESWKSGVTGLDWFVPMGRLATTCGPITKCPQLIMREDVTTWVAGIGFVSKPKITQCIP
jgi:hypothetical protein